ncbi:7 transmembrane receptor [Ancylostoma caninum]|uniref:7 transmembrane receptor n=1 Tax=Ancylostoma caninum TaxID=29170 RepID=A0A368GXD4_ANCCA|nr:7 transmembrane receptor [Ancylostoma caninum]
MNGTAELVPLPMVIATLTFSIVGLVGNGIIIVATLISPSLRNRCNILICILGTADFVVCAYLIQLRIQMLRNWYFLKNMDCYFHSIYGLFALNIQAGMGLILGIDRLFAVSLPIRYSRLPKLLYVMMMMVVFSYAALMTLYGYWDSTEARIPICLPPTAYNNTSRLVWIGSNFVISLMVIVVYGTAHIKCRMLSAKNTHEPSIERIRRLLHSLSIVIGIYIFTWFLTVIALLVTQLLPLSPKLINEINQQLGWLVIINASMNFFIYMWRAPEYRRVFLYVMCMANKKDRSSSDFPSNHKSVTTIVVQKPFSNRSFIKLR